VKRILATLVLLLAVCAGSGVRAGTDEDVRALYSRFAAAQNARDLDQVRTLLLDSPNFLWVSDGKSFWGPDRMIERMAQFQRAEVWQVVPALDRASVVELDDRTAFMHLPLELLIGARTPGPDHLKWLVSILCSRTDQGWHIAALFTTGEKS
jgi:hypothetical protein